MKGFKVFGPDFKCRDFQYEENKVFEISEELKMCRNGIHFCEKAVNCFNYYSFGPSNIVCEVEALGEVVTEGDKSATNRLLVGKRLTWKEVLDLVNTGHDNTGYRNTGHQNTSNWNTGNYNTGDCNTGDYNSGHFNTNEPTVRMFNKDTGKKRDEITIPFINLKLTEWIPLESMSEQEKKDHPTAETTKGYLKTRTYHEAWAEAWGEADEQTKKAFTELPNFDPEIFKEITGINTAT